MNLDIQVKLIPLSGKRGVHKIKGIGKSIIEQDEIKIIKTFLYGYPTYSFNNNKLVRDATAKYILETKNIDGPIF